MIDAYLEFLNGLGVDGVLRIFWLFLIFEVPRYLVLDYVVVLIYALHQRLNRGAYQDARRALRLEQPLVSVIVPGKNEGRNFRQLALTMREQTYRNYELIVVDDGSDDDSALIGRSLERRGDIDLFLRNEVRGGKASAANLGLRYAGGKFVLHLDADCSLDRDALEKMLVPFYLDTRIGAVGGSLCVRNTNANLCTLLQSIEYYMMLSLGRLVASSLGILRIVSGAFGAYRRDILQQVGGWDIGPGLDGDITVKIRKAGYRIYQEAHAVALTDVPETTFKLARQRLRWDRSLVRFRLRKHLNVFVAHENFSLSNFLSFVENIFYSIILTISWYFYLFDVLTNFAQFAGFILLTNFILYTASKYLQFGALLIVARRKASKLKLLPYLPLMVFYSGYFLRIIRSVAYFTEFFFKASYRDPWNPEKTSRVAMRYKL
jgi:cellulose synthase/poly-beta-1,6-N-acetylglucosamine synthase-like glycosyltransferase